MIWTLGLAGAGGGIVTALPFLWAHLWNLQKLHVPGDLPCSFLGLAPLSLAILWAPLTRPSRAVLLGEQVGKGPVLQVNSKNREGKCNWMGEELAFQLTV